MNKVILIGRVGKDPEYRNFESGSEVANFTLATSEKFKDKDGKVQEQTEWHNVVAWGKIASTINSYVKKGSQIMVEGKIKTRSWKKDNGEKAYSTDINLERLELIGSKPQDKYNGDDLPE